MWFVSRGDKTSEGKSTSEEATQVFRLRSPVERLKIRPGTRIQPNCCFRGGDFDGEPLCPGNGRRGGDGASQGAAVAETVRKREGGATRAGLGEEPEA